jgi:hypothetical protein
MICPNKNTPEWKAISNAHPTLAYYLWNKYEGNIPSYYTQPVAKEGVTELFESNPELANAVYEALGFKNTVTEKTISTLIPKNEQMAVAVTSLPTTGIINYKDIKKSITSSDYESYLNNHPSVLNEKAKDLYNRLLRGEKLQNEKILLSTDGVLLDGTHRFKARLVLGQTDFKYSTVSEDFFKQSYAKTIVEGYNEAKLKNNNIELLKIINALLGDQITPQQKQQAQQQYSQYLDSIFPESKVQDIVYHDGGQGKIKEEGFRKDMIGIADGGVLGDGFYFYVDRNKRYDSWRSDTESVLLNITNLSTRKDIIDQSSYVGQKPTIGSSLYEMALSELSGIPHDSKRQNPSGLHGKYIGNYSEQLAKIGIDGLTGPRGGNTEIVVFEPEQIHILGSQKDIEGFKQFVSNSNPMTSPDMSNLENTEFEVIKCRED